MGDPNPKVRVTPSPSLTPNLSRTSTTSTRASTLYLPYISPLSPLYLQDFDDFYARVSSRALHHPSFMEHASYMCYKARVSVRVRVRLIRVRVRGRARELHVLQGAYP